MFLQTISHLDKLVSVLMKLETTVIPIAETLSRVQVNLTLLSDGVKILNDSIKKINQVGDKQEKGIFDTLSTSLLSNISSVLLFDKFEYTGSSILQNAPNSKRLIANISDYGISLSGDIGNSVDGLKKVFLSLEKSMPFSLMLQGIESAIISTNVLIIYWKRLVSIVFVVASALKNFFSISYGIGFITALVSLFNSVISMNTIVLVVATFIGAISLLVMNINFIKQLWVSFLDSLYGLGIIGEWISGIFERIINSLIIRIGSVIETFSNLKSLFGGNILEVSTKQSKEMTIDTTSKIPSLNQLKPINTQSTISKKSLVRRNEIENHSKYNGTTINIKKIEIANDVIKNLDDFILKLKRKVVR